MKTWIKKKIQKWLGFKIYGVLEPGKIYVLKISDELALPENYSYFRKSLDEAERELNIKFLILSSEVQLKGMLKEITSEKVKEKDNKWQCNISGRNTCEDCPIHFREKCGIS